MPTLMRARSRTRVSRLGPAPAPARFGVSRRRLSRLHVRPVVPPERAVRAAWSPDQIFGTESFPPERVGDILTIPRRNEPESSPGQPVPVVSATATGGGTECHRPSSCVSVTPVPELRPRSPSAARCRVDAKCPQVDSNGVARADAATRGCGSRHDRHGRDDPVPDVCHVEVLVVRADVRWSGGSGGQ